MAKKKTSKVVRKKKAVAVNPMAGAASRKVAPDSGAKSGRVSSSKKKKALTVAVDFDGVLHMYSKGFQDGSIYDQPVPGAAQALQALKEKGYKIYIFSTRSNKIFHKKDSGDQNAAMEAYLKKHQIPYDRIWSFGKPMADIFIDDRAIGFRGDWQDTLQAVLSFKVWTEKD